MQHTSFPDTLTSAGDARQVRRVATGLLIALSLVFSATHVVDEPSTWVRLIRAMAEAGMVGAIADWFAVEALFRRPLGLPIPHTALLPRNKDRAASNIARFIDEFFLSPDQILGRIKALRPAEQVARWLSLPENSRMVATELSGFIRVILMSAEGQELPPDLKARIVLALTSSVDPSDVAQRLANVLREALETDFTAEAVRALCDTIDTNRAALTQVAQQKSRWWIAGSVDRRIVALMLDAVIELLDDLAQPDSKLGREFRIATSSVISRFEQDGTLSLLVRDLLRSSSNHDAAAAAIGDTLDDILAGILKKLDDDPSSATLLIGDAIQSVAASLLDKPAVLSRLDAQVSEFLMPLLARVRPSIAQYIEQTIRAWDSELLVDRIEREVGRDLQFIRINGAVLGALVGGAIFGVTQGLFH